MSVSKQRQIKTVKCPYMPQHIMPEGSLLNHLSKCSATNKHLFTKCKYNPIHVYPNHMIDQHYKKCKSKAQFQKNEESSDDWDAQEDQVKQDKNAQAKQESNVNQLIPADQSAITLRSDSESEEQAKKSSDEEDFDQAQQKLQNISIVSKKTENNKKPDQSFQSFTRSEDLDWKPSKNNTSKTESNKNNQSHSKSRQTKKESSLNQTESFVYEESEPQQKTKTKKKGNETLQSITESEKSLDYQTKIKEKKKAQKKLEDDDFQVQDF